MNSLILAGHDLSIRALLRLFAGRIAVTWLMTLGETVLLALVPLFIGFAIDGLLSNSTGELINLGILFASLVAVAVIRRVYDTRVYSAIRVELGRAQTSRGSSLPISTLNAQIGMGRELVEFLEETLPMVMTGMTQLVVAVIILYSYSPILAASSVIAATSTVLVYAIFHRRFYRLNGEFNRQTEKQVSVLEGRKLQMATAHLLRLRRAEVRISDTEAGLYGLVFVLLLALILFNIWHATTTLAVTTGAIFAIISYSWDFVDGTITLPATLQNWTRLSEITQRINGDWNSD
ncbi:MAG: ABC transporter six-transmembrane domain-containing protein [Pseudomonadota bacterium]